MVIYHSLVDKSMLDFIIVALPRSGTTWTANWLNSGEVSCLHDPLWHTHYLDLRRADGKAVSGICCTGLWQWADWVNAQNCRKLILTRPVDEVQRSLSRNGLPRLRADAAGLLAEVQGRRIPHTAVFDPARAETIWNYLVGDTVSFDATRHSELRQMRIEPNFATLQVDPSLARRLASEVRRMIQ